MATATKNAVVSTPDLDLTAAIEAAIRADEDEMDRQNPELGGVLRFDELEPDEQASHRAWAEAVVTAIAPLIAVQVAEQIATQVTEQVTAMQDDYLPSPHLDPAWIAGWRAAMRHAAAWIAREWGAR